MSKEMFELQCEICANTIGLFDIANIALPLSGAMFESIGDGYAPPFVATAPWEAFFCPRCHKRAIIDPNRIKTDKGMLSFTAGPKNKLNFSIAECIDPVTEAEIIAKAQTTYSALVTVHDEGIVILPQENISGRVGWKEGILDNYFQMEITEDDRIILHRVVVEDEADVDDSGIEIVFHIGTPSVEDEAPAGAEHGNTPDTADMTEGSEDEAPAGGGEPDDSIAGGDDEEVGDQVLLGSNLLPAIISTLNGEVTLGEVVCATQEKSGMSVDEWNDLVRLDNGDSERLLNEHIKSLNTPLVVAATHILWNKNENDMHMVGGEMVTGTEEEVTKVMHSERSKGVKGLVVDPIEEEVK
jgi:hypothetical protein